MHLNPQMKRFPFYSTSQGRCSFFKKDGKLFVFGKNEGGLGLGNLLKHKNPVQLNIKQFETIKKATFGDGHTILITDTNKVFSSGSNSHGQCGLGDTYSRIEFEEIKKLQNYQVEDCCCGYYHTTIRTKIGFFACGRNKYGALGIGKKSDMCVSPEKVIFPKSVEVTSMTAGSDYTLFLSSNGKLYLVGTVCTYSNNTYKHLRKMRSKERFVAISGGHKHFICLSSRGRVFSRGIKGQCGFQMGMCEVVNKISPIKMLSKFNIVQISCGYWFTYVLSDKGEMVVFGGHTTGELGLGDIDNLNCDVPRKVADNVAQIHGCGHSGFFITNKGKVWATGKNDCIELGDVFDESKRNITKWMEHTKIPELDPVLQNNYYLSKNLLGALQKKIFIDITISHLK